MWIKLSGALLAAMSMVSLADAGLFSSRLGCGAEKGCGCASTCQPACCKPVIVKPCCPNVYTYQRKCSDIKPPCCDTCCPPATCCAPAACAPAATCAPAPAACAPACAAPAATCAPAPAACAPACAAPAATCAPAPAACAPACAAPAAACAPAPAACAPACAAPAACAPACAAPAACAPAACAPGCAAPAVCAPACSPKKGLLSGLFKSKKLDCGSCNTCAAPAPATCAAPCEVRCCNADPCEVAKLIYESQTACYAKDRRSAIHKLGDKFDCICNPEIMTAFIVGLNDCDERVRRKAADEIGDQIRKNCCCCPEVVAALTCSLGDCDKHVVKQATEALELCGYEVVNGNCDTCAATCTTGACNSGCAPASAPAVAPAPAPVPPMTTRTNSGLNQLLGLLD